MKASKLAIRFGIQIGALLILYFLILSIIGVHTNPLYSLGNGIIMAIGLYYALKKYKRVEGVSFTYYNSFITGLFTGGNATLLFSVFFAIYTTHLNPNFLPEMLANWSSHYHVTVGTVVFIAVIMGFATTFVLTLAFMQLFKTSWNSKKINFDV